MNTAMNRTQAFRYDRFGMFIHFGIYAIPARGEWVRSTEKMRDEDYMRYFREFNPVNFRPREWARMAKEAGMKYLVLTAKHHDGFCLFDSRYTDFKSTNTPYHKDMIREYVDAVREEGLKVGLYYSLLDWNHPAYPAYNHYAHPRREDESCRVRRPFEEYQEYMLNQIRELCTNYGKIDIMWFDSSYGEMQGEKWRATELIRMIRELQPDMITDNRLECGISLLSENPSVYSGDFVSPEAIIPPEGFRNVRGEPVPWEACITMNDSWGYKAEDKNFKDASFLIKKLVECVSKGGNLMLNVGPNAYGEIPKESKEALTGIGEWMKHNSEGIYGCGISEFPKPEWGRYTQNGKDVYAFIMELPVGPLNLEGIPRERIDSVRCLNDGSELPIFDDWKTAGYPDKVFVNISQLKRYDPVSTVLRIRLK